MTETIALVLLLSLFDFGLTPCVAQQTQAAVPTSFEMASITHRQPAKGCGTTSSMSFGHGAWTADYVTLAMLIEEAYHVEDYQLSGLESRMRTERYNITARAGVPNLTHDQVRVLIQSLLAERFRLRIRREIREVPAYDLVVGSSGPKLKESGTPLQAETEAPAQAKPAGGIAVAGKDKPVGGTATEENFRMAPLSSLAAVLTDLLGKPVIDKTNLKGAYDFGLTWTRDRTERGSRAGGRSKCSPDKSPRLDVSGTSIFTALQEQLGLRLESSMEPLEMLVIVHIERPSGN